jgi:hypothetical protein
MILLADGFDEAVIGYGRQFNKDFAVYDYERCVEILMNRDGMTQEEADAYMEFNVIGSYMGEFTPVFLHTCSVDVLRDDISELEDY